MSKASFKEYRKLLRFVKPHLGLLIVASVCMGFSTIFGGASFGMIVPMSDKILSNSRIVLPRSLPPFLQNLVDTVNGMDRVMVLKVASIIIFFIFLGKMIFVFLQGYLMNMVGLRVVRDVRNRIFEKLQYLPLSFYTHNRTGELMSRITNDAALIHQATTTGVTDFIYQLMQVFFFSGVVLYIHFKMAVFFLFVFPIIVYPVMVLGKKIKKFTHKIQEKMADINSILNENIQAAKLVKAFHTETHEIERFQKTNYHHYRFNLKTCKRMIIIPPFSEFFGAIGGIAILWLVGREVISGRLSFGVFALFMASLMSLMSPFKKITGTYTIFQQALSASERIYQILDLETEPQIFAPPAGKEVSLDSVEKGIAFRDVSFKYLKNDDYVLKNVTFEVRKNNIVAFVGESGAGKTTIINLLLRFYDPQEGSIMIDGKDIRNASIYHLRRLMGIVPQETILFNDTVAANIAYGDFSAPDALIKNAARQALCDDFIMKLPQGYQTIIGDRGMKLSGGERQRIALARVILRDPQILILDEATSNLDNQSEHLIQKALHQVVQNKTVFVIAHRLSTIQQAHQIIVLDKGCIREIGTHQDLLKNSTVYKRLYELQFSR